MTLGIILTLTVCLTIGVTNCAQTACSEGTYLLQFDDKSFCEVCPAGTFMPWKNHTASTCFKCTKIENSTVEILISPCDRFHDADIQCKDGYFRRLARHPRDEPSCLQCRPACPEHFFQVHRCENFTDLGCCPGENYDFEFYNGNSGPRRCRERPWVCGKGHYLDTAVNYCKPCPRNTFMPEDTHSHPYCWDCHYKLEAELPLHSVITQNCTSTAPTRYRCKDGFYMNHSMGIKGYDIGCSPCHSCDEGMYEVRQCDGYHDTVCCHKPNMTVMDMPLRGQCIKKIDELLTYPSVESLQVRKGGCQSVMCYTALAKKKANPDLTWFGPNVDESQQFQFEDENYQSGVTVYFNTLTLCNFSNADEGTYHCLDNLRTLNQEIQIYIGVACRYGTYNPPECDKTCSQHCLVSEESDGSPCHHNNGTCLFGCQEGYTGPLCEEGGNGTEPVADSTTIILSIALVLVILVVALCLVYNKRCPGAGPKWWRSLANQIFDFRRATTGDGEQIPLMNVKVTPTGKQDITLDQVKKKVVKMVHTLRQTKNKTVIQDNLKKIYDISWKYFELREDIGDYLAELGFPEMCMAYLEDYLTTVEHIQDNQIWSAINNVSRLCRYCGVASSNFTKSLVDVGAVQILTGILSKRDYLDNLDGERESVVVKYTVVGLRHLAMQSGNIHDFQKCQSVQVLENLTKAEDESIKSLAKITIDSLGRVERKVQATDTPGTSKRVDKQESEDDSKSANTVPIEGKLEIIWLLFVSYCVPMTIVHLFHFYTGGVLVQDDIDMVASATSKYGRFYGASELWNRLVGYEDWYRILLLVLRDPQVKQGHVAELMENVVGTENLGSPIQKLKVYSTKLSDEIKDVTNEINKAKQKNAELTADLNRARQEIGKPADENKRKYRDNAQRQNEIDKEYQENANKIVSSGNPQERPRN